MNNSQILSWDDYEDGAPVQTKPVEAPVVETVEVTKTVMTEQPVVADAKPEVTDLDYVDLSDEDLLAGMKDLELSGERVRAEDKRMILGNSDVNQLIPFQYEWCWQKYLDGSNNFWSPLEVNMADDVALWKSADGLTDDERLIVKRCLGFFSTADTVVGNNLVLSIFTHITAPEARQYLSLQNREEAMHVHAYQYIIESLGMDGGEIFNMYREVKSVERKAAWCLKHTENICHPDFNMETKENQKTFLKNLIAFYMVAEGIFFYCGFPLILSMGRRNKLTGIAEQFQLILRDESMHLNFGADVINTIIKENPELWDEEMKAEATKLIREGVALEKEFARDTMARGVLGMNAKQMCEYLEFIGNRRLQQIGLNPIFENHENPYPWMSEMMDLRKEKNFFETRVTEYQVGGALTWD